MGDEEKTEEKAPEKVKKPLLGNPMIMVAIIIVFQAAIAFMMIKMLAPKQAEATDVEPKVEKVVEDSDPRGEIILMSDIVINLKEKDKLFFLKVTIGLEVPDSDVKAEVTERTPQLRDDVIAMISGKSVSDIDSLEDRNLLKAELTRRINASLLSGDLIQLYFSDFVIQ
ncbi:MAG: flagellar basal body-associated FliL family protein [Candidatus Krumholzibacteriota bacterium]|nr:flagellar basal body-associated FliL family protein [Candidatus Krumholzibacteriota bacterium]